MAGKRPAPSPGGQDRHIWANAPPECRVSPPAQAKTSPTGDERNHLRTLLTLVPYLWPQGECGLRARVVVSLGLLVFA
jgi:hypothetical protein